MHCIGRRLSQFFADLSERHGQRQLIRFRHAVIELHFHERQGRMRCVQIRRIDNRGGFDVARLPRKPALLRQILRKIESFQPLAAGAFEKALPTVAHVNRHVFGSRDG